MNFFNTFKNGIIGGLTANIYTYFDTMKQIEEHNKKLNIIFDNSLNKIKNNHIQELNKIKNDINNLNKN